MVRTGRLRYNAEWLVEKVGFVSLRRARELHGLRRVAYVNSVSKEPGALHHPECG